MEVIENGQGEEKEVMDIAKEKGIKIITIGNKGMRGSKVVKVNMKTSQLLENPSRKGRTVDMTQDEEVVISLIGGSDRDIELIEKMINKGKGKDVNNMYEMEEDTKG